MRVYYPTALGVRSLKWAGSLSSQRLEAPPPWLQPHLCQHSQRPGLFPSLSL